MFNFMKMLGTIICGPLLPDTFVQAEHKGKGENSSFSSMNPTQINLSFLFITAWRIDCKMNNIL